MIVGIPGDRGSCEAASDISLSPESHGFVSKDAGLWRAFMVRGAHRTAQARRREFLTMRDF
jgi:hypothetical protein